MIDDIRKRLKSQDNQGTANPMFVVFTVDKSPTREDFSNLWEYANLYDGYFSLGTTRAEILKGFTYECGECDIKFPDNVNELDDEDLIEYLNKNFEVDIIKNHYIEVDRLRGIFLTYDSAKSFIAKNDYNLGKTAYIMCESWYRNPEMQYIRDSIINGKLGDVEKAHQEERQDNLGEFAKDLDKLLIMIEEAQRRAITSRQILTYVKKSIKSSIQEWDIKKGVEKLK